MTANNRTVFDSDGLAQAEGRGDKWRIFTGAHHDTHMVDARIGEWGGTQFPIGYEAILVHMKSGLVEWAPILDVGGRQHVLVQRFRHGGTVGGVDLRVLAQGREEGVALDALVEHLPKQR